jgi:hypothetical protein
MRAWTIPATIDPSSLSDRIYAVACSKLWSPSAGGTNILSLLVFLLSEQKNEQQKRATLLPQAKKHLLEATA